MSSAVEAALDMASVARWSQVRAYTDEPASQRIFPSTILSGGRHAEGAWSVRARILYDSRQVVELGALLGRFSALRLDTELHDLHFVATAEALCDCLDVEAVNVLDGSVQDAAAATLLGYALASGRALIVTPQAQERLPEIAQDAANVIVARADAVEQGLAKLLSRLDGNHIFPDGHAGLFGSIDPAEPVAIVCAEIPEEMRPEYGKENYRDFLRYATFADVDALIQLMVGFAASKHRAVQAYTSSKLPENALSSHILVVGGPAWNKLARSLYFEIGLPIEHRDGGSGNPDPIVDVFTGDIWLPEFLSDGEVVSDVGFVSQVPSPYEPGRTATIFGGVLTHGVEASVKLFTSSAVREKNWAFVKPLQEPPSQGFCVLFRAKVVSNNNVSPDLRQPGVMLAAYSYCGSRFVRVRAS
jgi:hypothetical protein